MTEFLKTFADIMNNCHDKIIDWLLVSGYYSVTDKQLHFVIFGVLGAIIFLFVHVLFKFLARFNIAIISFIYTLTILIILTFAIEVQQKITGRGVMDFTDAAYGIYGFLFAFGGWLVVKWGIILVKKIIDFLKRIDF